MTISPHLSISVYDQNTLDSIQQKAILVQESKNVEVETGIYR